MWAEGRTYQISQSFVLDFLLATVPRPMVMLHFVVAECKECARTAVTLESIVSVPKVTPSGLALVTIDVAKAPQIALEYGVTETPTVLFMRNEALSPVVRLDPPDAVKLLTSLHRILDTLRQIDPVPTARMSKADTQRHNRSHSKECA